MAAEVGLAFLTASLDVLFDRLASPELLNFIKGKKLDQGLLQRFQTTLYAVGAVLNDAEQKQIKDLAVKKWLDDLKDAVYEADDLLDELSTRAATQKEVRNVFNLYFKDREMGSKIEEIIRRLEEITKHKDVLGLQNIAGKMLTQRPKSTSPLVESDVCGREKDKEAIINFLLSDDTSDGKKIGVIPIVGLGGIGKTTLAQLVYNDDRVKQKFNLRAWVCVSEDFDVSKIMRNIMEEISGGPCYKENPNSLHLDLQERLKAKKFLIVLDDIGNERGANWDPLTTLFHHGHEGSKIILTARSTEAASMVSITSMVSIASNYCLGDLSDEDCWSIFVRQASPSQHSISNSLLEKVRDDIIGKCKGLPLAAKMLGSLLRSKSDIKIWKIVLRNDIWDSPASEGVSTLRVSYYYLPSHLKRCFLYCSLFPKDFEFKKEELILLWMAEGLLHPTDKNMTLEEVGCAYFEELTSRFFFQPSKNSEEIFVMHDLIHDLAESFAGEFYRRVQNAGGNNIGNKTRHISYSHDKCDLAVSMFEAIKNSKALRTFLNLSLRGMTSALPQGLLEILLSNCKCLRVLSLHTFKSFEVLPHSNGELIHLRYLDLSSTDIRSLPDSIFKLHNLQTLKLRHCSQLTKLPDDIQGLVNLRYLDVWKTKIQEMPMGMGKLTNLHYLSDFVVGKDKGSKIGELGGLSDLANKLRIWNLENVSNKEEVSQAKMMDKKCIEKLQLHWGTYDADDAQTEEDILEKLQPYTNLKDLLISGYMGTRFSHWLGHHSYSNMNEITLSDCKNCYSLPPLGQLLSLKVLRVGGFEMLETIDDGFYKSSDSSLSRAFPSLESLSFESMHAWEKWCLFEKDAFPLLRRLELRDCPKIVGDLPKHLPSLEELEIVRCQQLALSLTITAISLSIDTFPHLQWLHIDGCGNLESVSVDALSSVESVHIKGCENLKSVSVDTLSSVESVHIDGCENLKSVSVDTFSSVESVHIDGCENLKSVSVKTFSIVESVHINGCENLRSVSVEAFSIVESVHINGCENLKSVSVDTFNGCENLKSVSVDTFSSVESVHIDGCENLRSVSVDNFSSVESVHIDGCENLRSVSVDTFSSVESVHIDGCENLRSVSVDNFSSVESLYINGCGNLESVSVDALSSVQSFNIRE